MSRDDDEKRRASRRALRILGRLSGTGSGPDEGEGLAEHALESTRVADRLHQIEQLFLLHGGERDADGPEPEKILFEWGHLQVLEKIGEGSSGEVFRAYDQTLDRDVALKLLKTDQGRPFQSQLFLHEARQLAMVRHRNVLAVHGAAVHEGRPGLWTELMGGGTADDAAHAKGLKALDATLDLVESLALAVDAVHSAGLVHGDIKPSNIMRDASGDWVLMDFGASQDQRRGSDGPSITSGTPLYMAPEVALGGAPDVASDRYSFGATLYRILSGRAPIEAKSWNELVQKHNDGVRPFSSAGTGTLDSRIARMIDRLMSPDADQRPTLHEVLAEIRSIREAPQRRFRRRALGGIAAALLLGLTLTSIGFYRANEARLVAEEEQRKTSAVNEFLQHVLFSPASSGRGRDLTVEEMLLEASENLERSLADQPEARVIVRRVLADSYHTLRLHDRAEEQIRIARAELQSEGLRLPSIERKLSLVEMLVALADDRYEETIDLSKAFVERHGDELDVDHEDIQFARIYQLDSYNALGRYGEAEAFLDRYFADVPAPETATNNNGFNILRNRANLYRQQGRMAEALEVAEQAVEWLNRYPRAADNDRNGALTNLAIGLAQANELSRAVEVFAELVPLQRRIYGSGTDEYIGALSNLAFAQYEIGRPTESLATLGEALEVIHAEGNTISDRQRLIVKANQANALVAIGETDRGEVLLRETRSKVIESMGEKSAMAVMLEYNLAELLSDLGRFEEARALAESTLAIKAEIFGEGHYLTLLSQDNLAVALAGLGEYADALAMQDAALTPLREQLGADHPHVLLVERHRLGTLQRSSPDRLDLAEVDDLIRRHEQAFGIDHPKTEKARALR